MNLRVGCTQIGGTIENSAQYELSEAFVGHI